MNNDMISLAYDGGPDSLIDEKVFRNLFFVDVFQEKEKSHIFQFRRQVVIGCMFQIFLECQKEH